MARRLATAGATRLAGGCLALCLALPSLLAQTPTAARPLPQDPQAPTFRTGIDLVRVDVVATDREGRQVSDLTADDFTVTDDGKRQTISGFKRVSSDGGVATGAALPTSADAAEDINSSPDDIRLFAVFLDDYHVSARWSGIARDQVARFVEDTLGPADLVAVMHPLTPLAEVRLARNRAAVATAIRGFDGVRGLNLGDGDPRRGSMTTIRRDASLTALQALIMRLGSLKDGRKTLLLVSEGYGANLESLGKLKELGELASRNNTAIYPVFAGVARPNYQDDTGIQAETLRVLAERSGGRVIFDGTRTNSEFRERVPETGVPVSKLAMAMRQVAVDASAYYLLGYTPADAVPDGQFHKIVVRAKRPGVELRYRQGYVALPPGEHQPLLTAAPATPVEKTRAFDVISRDRMVLLWVGMSRGPQQTTRVTVAWDPRPPSACCPAGALVPKEALPAHLVLTATGPSLSGTGTASYFEGRTPDASSASSGSHASFDVPPGPLQLRVSVENSVGVALDSDVQTIQVPDLSGPATWMSTPALYRSRSVTEWRQLTSRVDASPTAGRDFDRTDRLLIRVTSYATHDQSVAVMAALLNRAGQQLTVLRVAPSRAAGASAALWEIDLPLQSLARGDYGVRVSVSAGDSESSETVAFRVN